MRFLIVTHVLHKKQGNQWYAYGPYVREMNLWSKNVQELLIVAPCIGQPPGAIDLAYAHDRIRLLKTPALRFNTPGALLRSVILLPGVLLKIIKAMRQADHIHLRCPGNMGLLGCLAQVFFPAKPKTAKYAGNWDWNSRQPFSYRLQQRILRNTFLTRNMKTLVYGLWPDQNNNILPFFTASYRENELSEIKPRTLHASEPVKLLFAGALRPGKNPVLALETALLLRNKGFQVQLDYYGEGPERAILEEKIAENGCLGQVLLHGNVDAEMLKQAYQEAHFLIFPSRSEGWPKVVAEAMVWGCLPVSTRVSCVPDMLGNGERGLLVPFHPESIAAEMEQLILHPETYYDMVQKAMVWSRAYTLDRFASEIQQLLTPDEGVAPH